MGLKSAFKRFFELDDDNELEENHEHPQQDVQTNSAQENQWSKKEKKKHNVVSLQSVQKSTRVVLIEPKLFAEVQDIANELKNHRSVVINLQRLSIETSKRVVDFLSGTVYALDGEIQKLGQETFLCVPENVDITGVISEMMDNNEELQ